MKSKTPLLIALFVGLPCLMPIVFKPMVENASPFMGMPIFLGLVGLFYIVDISFLINISKVGLGNMAKYIIRFMFAFSLTFNLLETLTYVPGFNLPNLYIRFWISLLFSVASTISMDADEREKEYEERKKEYEERRKEYEERRKK